jgi:SSS family solute:Na+ symporter
MTVPELFEQRYGKFVRWLAGVVIVLGGLLNMGVFLRIGGEFLVVACGVDPQQGASAILTVMTVLLLAVATYTILGGMLSVLVTDFLQFVVMSAGLIVVTLFVLWKVGWSQITAGVEAKLGPGGFNPFLNADLGWPFVVSNLLTSVAAVMTWQSVIARVLSAKDSATGRRVYTGTSFFFICRWIIPGLWGMAAISMAAPEALHSIAGALGEKNPGLLAMPYFLALVVPTGLMGLLIAAMLAAEMSTDSSYMLTWGGVIYNDIIGPFRRRPPSERVGLLWNRFIVAGIGVFLLLWGLWYKVEGNVWEYLQTTGTIYLAAMSTLLVACCYWKRANDWGAIAAIVVGAALPALALTVNKLVVVEVDDGQGAKLFGWVARHIGDSWVNIGTYAAVVLAMVVGSLLKPARGAKEVA